MRRTSAVAACALAAVPLAGCTSTQEKARHLAAQGKDAFTEKGLKIDRVNPDVRVVDRAVLTDQNGSAAVVVLRNRSHRAQVKVPVAIDVLGRGRKSVFRNDAPGLEPSLTGVTVIPPGRTFSWVNDQVTAASRPRTVVAKVGLGRGKVPRAVPKLAVSKVRLSSELSSGIAAVGKVTNRSQVDQRDVVLYGIARRGGRIVAAGRAQVRRVRPGASTSFRMFFIGSPKGGRLTISVPPTRL